MTLPKMPAVGALDQRVTLQAPRSTVDGRGQRILEWEDVATVWAQAQPLRGREFFAAGQMQSSVEVRFRIRHRPDVQGSWRLLWRGVPYALVGEPIDVDGGRHTLELMCASGNRAEAA